MPFQTWASVFANAALPQKAIIVALVAMLILTVAAAAPALAKDDHAANWRRIIGALGLAGPVLGLLTGAANSFHMAQTIRRLPVDVTARQLAPGILEVSTLIGLGAAVGVLAAGAQLFLALRRT